MMGRRNLFLAAVTVGSAFVTDGVNAQLTALGSSDLGTPAIAGSHTGSGSDWAVTAAGTDIWVSNKERVIWRQFTSTVCSNLFII